MIENLKLNCTEFEHQILSLSPVLLFGFWLWIKTSITFFPGLGYSVFTWVFNRFPNRIDNLFGFLV